MEQQRPYKVKNLMTRTRNAAQSLGSHDSGRSNALTSMYSPDSLFCDSLKIQGGKFGRQLFVRNSQQLTTRLLNEPNSSTLI